MATVKKKTTTTKSTEKEPAKKTTAKTETKKPAAKKPVEKKVEAVDSNITLEFLHDELMKMRAELEVLKAFNKKSEEGVADDKIYKEIENIKELLYDMNERFEELEYQYGDLKENY